MPLSWNEIKDRALTFSKEWQRASRERAEKDSFWNDFFQVFGISRRRVATFEEPVKKLGDKQGYIDLFWKGMLIAEHKSKGKNLDAAYTQATDYFYGLEEHELPKYVIVSDFEKIRLYDLENQTQIEFEVKDFHQEVHHFGFMAGYQKRHFQEQDPVNIQAAEMMGKLHDSLKESGYTGKNLELYLVRILFCLFADDTGIFEKNTFRELIEQRCNFDGSDLGLWMAQFFQTLNTPLDKRQRTLDEQLAAFPYINGNLFAEALPIAAFNAVMRQMLLDCSKLDWGKISPAIFGSMFQSVMNPTERRNLGAHYTSEKNILKLIKPLFLDELHKEFEKIKNNKNKLRQFHQKIGDLAFFDPACGCGNFLIITYRELRLLELEVLKILYGTQMAFQIEEIIKVDVDQFYGIEYDEFAARIAEVAMWLIDHQMNLKISETFGQYYARLPIRKSAKIHIGNALRLPWHQFADPEIVSYVLGNPPFVGSKLLDKTQRADMARLFAEVNNGKILDYVSAWYLLAAQYIQKTNIKVAFVSTNSITQGEQVSVLWNELLNHYHIKIHFAHNTFKWSNEARGKAAVYCVIIGFAAFEPVQRVLYAYADVKGEADRMEVKKLNPYLVAADDIIIVRQKKPIVDVPHMAFGNMPLDGGNLLFTNDEKEAFVIKEPQSEKWFKPLISAREFLQNQKRWCLWLVDIKPQELKSMPAVLKRVEAVKAFRLASKAPSTQKHAATPALFRDRKNPKTFILIPSTSSENRKYIPMGFFTANNIANNSCHIIPNGTFYHFGILMSEMHMAWVKYTCGRLKSDFRYSKDIVYNNFPWALDVSLKARERVESSAAKVLEVRSRYSDSSLSDLYDPLLMPTDLVKAHQSLDKAVDLCYRSQPFTNETARIAYLFELYNQYTAPLFQKEKKRRRQK
ncbi:MAG: class I SAM-dependent DNA methyltransferase [Bernardetiaceae bacterium]|nr:class I SAM-dependent DNA methyltransferase [Bernardetiaceae bacterium]